MFRYHMNLDGLFVVFILCKLIWTAEGGCICSDRVFAEDINEGVISSPNYPNAYCSNMKCTYKIVPVAGKTIQLTVVESKLEDYDTLKLYEYKNGSDVYIREHQIGSYTLNQTFTSSRGFDLIFKSDNSVEMRGFLIKFWRKAPEHCSCSHVIFNRTRFSGEIFSPNYPQPYCPLRKCTYTILPLYGAVVELKVRENTLEEGDYLELYQYDNRSGRQTYIYQGRIENTNEEKIYVSSIGFELRFHSDYIYEAKGFSIRFHRDIAMQSLHCPMPYLNAGATENEMIIPNKQFATKQGCVLRIEANSDRKVALQVISKVSNFFVEGREEGKAELLWRDSDKMTKRHFSQISTMDLWIYGDGVLEYNAENLPVLRYREIDFEPCVCSDNKLHLSGNETAVVTSPGYPDQFCPSFSCMETISLAETENENSSPAFLVIMTYLGHSNEESLTLSTEAGEVQKFKGDKYLNFVRAYPGSTLGISFSTTNDVINHGYNATIQRIEIRNECLPPNEHGGLLSREGSYTMHIPSYCQFLRFYLTIEHDEQKTAKFRMNVVYHLNDPYESIEIWDNKEITYLQPATYSGSMNYLTEASSVQIYYKRESWFPEAHGNSSTVNITWDWQGFCRCGPSQLVAAGSWQHLLSPDYPQEYCDEMQCIYRISAPSDHRIVLNTTFFETTWFQDKLYIYNGEEAMENLIDVLHGTQKNLKLIRSPSNLMTLKFISENGGNKKGFVINYKTEKIVPKTTTTSTPTPTTTATIMSTIIMSTTTTTPTSTESPSTTTTTQPPPTTAELFELTTTTTLSPLNPGSESTTNSPLSTNSTLSSVTTQDNVNETFTRSLHGKSGTSILSVSNILITAGAVILIAAVLLGLLVRKRNQQTVEVPTVYYADDRVRTSSTADSAAPLCGE